MDVTIENQFFKAFGFGGVCYECIEWIRVKHHLPAVRPISNKPKQLKGRWPEYYDEVLPKSIAEETKAFEVFASKNLSQIQSPLMDEIASNLDECKDKQVDRYLFSLLRPFGGSGCDISKVLHPVGEINGLKGEIAQIKKDREQWQVEANDYSEFSEATINAREIDPTQQVEACNRLIKARKEQIQWVIYVASQFVEMLTPKKIVDGSVEDCFGVYVDALTIFANRLDALLLSYGIDLLRLQEQCEIYLLDHRDLWSIEFYVGSIKLTQQYIDALPKPQPMNDDAQRATNEPQQGGVWLPDGLLTDEACKAFEKAIKAGIIKPVENGYRKSGITKAQLGYFLQRIYLPNSPAPDNRKLPEVKLNALFGETRLAETIRKLCYNIDNKPKGYDIIDQCFE